MSKLFPDEPEEYEDEPIEEYHTALYATADGWMIHNDLEMNEFIDSQNINNQSKQQIADLLAKNIPGSYVRLPDAIVVVLDGSTNWTIPTK